MISLPTAPSGSAAFRAMRADRLSAVSLSSIPGLTASSQPSTELENTPAAGAYTVRDTWSSELPSCRSWDCLSSISCFSCPAAAVLP